VEAAVSSSGGYVDGFSFALGGRQVSVHDSVAGGHVKSGAAELLAAGFRQHHICSPSETAYDLARSAVAGLGAERLVDIDAIVYATCLPANAGLGDEGRFAETGDVKYLMDFPASRLQADLGLDGAAVFGLTQQACTSALGSIRVASALLAAEPDLNRILCVTADRFPPGAHYEQAYNLISDGAAACVVSRSPGGYRLLAAHQITNGAMVTADDDETVGAYFTYTHRLVCELLAKAALTVAELDWVVPQNTNVKAWQILSRLLGIDSTRVFQESLPDIGHMISGDNLVNMAYLCTRRTVLPGEKLLLVIAGYGMNWQGLLLEKV
jgi:3-oxoacyl-[acyl-carrier-protein] synthase III